jgi:hypothetical protein
VLWASIVDASDKFPEWIPRIRGSQEQENPGPIDAAVKIKIRTSQGPLLVLCI